VSWYESCIGHTAVNIGIPFEHGDIQLTRFEYTESAKDHPSPVSTSYSELLNLYSAKDLQKEKAKRRKNTFLVFHNGKVNMSGIPAFMFDSYNEFLSTLVKNKEHFMTSI
jgi:hypothetical protein